MQFFLTLLPLFFISCGPPLELDWPKEKAIPSESPIEEEWFKIIVLDVGQGDATLLMEPGNKAILIDTGPPEKGPQVIQEVLRDQAIHEIQNIFISHDHDDHSGGLQEVLSELNLNSSIVIDKNNARVGQTISLGPASIVIKAANGQIGDAILVGPEQRSDENNLSLALLIQYGAFKYFTDGDLPGGGGEPPYQTSDLETPLAPQIGDVDILLVPHHGSHTSSNENFLNTLKPEMAILSLGNGNDFFHPHPSVVTRLKNHGIKIVATEKGWLRDAEEVEIVNGSICIVTDGETYQVKPYTLDKCSSPPSLSN